MKLEFLYYIYGFVYYVLLKTQCGNATYRSCSANNKIQFNYLYSQLIT